MVNGALILDMKSKTVSKPHKFGKVKFKYEIYKAHKQYKILRIKILKNELYVNIKWINDSFLFSNKIVFSRAKVGNIDSYCFNNNIVNVNVVLRKIINDDIIDLEDDYLGIQLK